MAENHSTQPSGDSAGETQQPKRKLKGADVRAMRYPGFTVFECGSKAALDWMFANAEFDNWQWTGNRLAVDWRFADDLLEALENAGLRVIREWQR
jgi:hypothetical protein